MKLLENDWKTEGTFLIELMNPLILKPKEHFDNKTVRTVRYNY